VDDVGYCTACGTLTRFSTHESREHHLTPLEVPPGMITFAVVKPKA
jgi:hypothetical protein